jgi:hypothetical protein
MDASMDEMHFRSQSNFSERVAHVGDVVGQSSIFLCTRGNVYMAAIRGGLRHVSGSNCASSSLSDLKGIGCKTIWTVQISPVFGAKGTTICLKTVKICLRPAHFSHRFFKSDRLLGRSNPVFFIRTNSGDTNAGDH